MAHSNTTSELAAGMKALNEGNKAFSHTQAMWRFLGNDSVTPERLSQPLLGACHASTAELEGDHVLCVHDWSRIHYGGHANKKDRLQMSHKTDIGYELQSSLLVSAEEGHPLSVAAQNLCSAQGVWQSRSPRQQASGQTHLDELSERIDWLEAQNFGRRLVHIVDREADSVAHLRRWSAQGSQWLVRVKAGSELRCGNTRIKASKLAENLNFEHTRRVLCKGQSCEQWTAGTNVVLARPARPKRLDAQGQRLAPVKGEPLALRLVVSKIVNEDGDVVAMWYLLSNAPEHIEDATLALWYYFRWQVESFFKLLKSAGHQLESWQQETARATFNRILIATQACVMAWRLVHASGEEARRTREFLVRLSGRQLKRSRPVTIPALLDGLFKLFTMLATLEHYSLSELKAFAKIAKTQLNL